MENKHINEPKDSSESEQDALELKDSSESEQDALEPKDSSESRKNKFEDLDLTPSDVKKLHHAYEKMRSTLQSVPYYLLITCTRILAETKFEDIMSTNIKVSNLIGSEPGSILTDFLSHFVEFHQYHKKKVIIMDQDLLNLGEIAFKNGKNVKLSAIKSTKVPIPVEDALGASKFVHFFEKKVLYQKIQLSSHAKSCTFYTNSWGFAQFLCEATNSLIHLLSMLAEEEKEKLKATFTDSKLQKTLSELLRLIV